MESSDVQDRWAIHSFLARPQVSSKPKQAAAAMAMAALSRTNTATPPRGPGKEHRTAITVPEFKLWVKQFDTDRDGRISRKELQEAIRRRGAWFSGLRALFAVRRADRNRNGFVDDSEIEGLIHFAETELGFRISME